MKRLVLLLSVLLLMGSGGFPSKGPEAMRPGGKSTSFPSGGPASSAAFTQPLVAPAPTPATVPIASYTGLSGATRVPTTTTIQGSVFTLAHLWAESGVSGAAWTANTGANLIEAGAGDSPVTGAPAPYTDGDWGLYFKAAKYFEAAANGDVSLGTGDIFLTGGVDADAAGDTIISQFTAGAYFEVVIDGSSQLVATFYDGSVLCTMTSDVLDLSTWHHFNIYLDRSYRGGMYVDSGGLKQCVAAVTGDISPAAKFTIGARSGGTTPLDGRVGWVALYTGGTHTDNVNATHNDAFTREVAGAHLPVASGTKAPTLLARAGKASVSIFDVENNRHLISYVPTDWVRTASRSNVSWGNVSDGAFVGVLSEEASENIALQNSSLDVTWAAVGSSTVTADALVAPDGFQEADTVNGVGTAEQGRTQNMTQTAASWVQSAYGKVGVVDHVYIGTDIADVDGYFDAADCLDDTTTLGSSVTEAYREDAGDGWCRFGIRYTSTAAAHALSFQCASADGVKSYAGSSADCSFWCTQVEQNDHMTSCIPTTTTAQTRAGDRLEFKGDDGNTVAGAGSLHVTLMTPSFTSLDTNNVVWLFTSGSNQITNGLTTGSGAASTNHFTGVNQWIQTNGVADWADGGKHTFVVQWDTDDVEMQFDAAQFTDTSATNPTPAFTTIMTGGRNTGTDQIEGLLVFDIYDVKEPGDAVVGAFGDSITRGTPYATVPYPTHLGNDTGRFVANKGVGGETCEQVKTRFICASANYSHLALMCGVNDLAAGTAATAIQTQIDIIVDTAQACSVPVILAQVLPWKDSSGWTAGKQTETDTLNAWIVSNDFGAGVTALATYAVFEDDIAADELEADYNAGVGDKIHLNDVGTPVLSTQFQGAL